MSFWLGGQLADGGELVWQAPSWQIGVAIVVAILALFGAWWSRREQPQALTKELVLWGIALALLVFALGQPAWISEKGRKDRGRYVVLIDSSASMQAKEDKVMRSSMVAARVQEIRDQIDGPVDIYHFSGELIQGLPSQYDGRETDIGAALNAIVDRYLGQQLQGIALLTDGIDRGALRRRSAVLSAEKFAENLKPLPGPLTIYQIGKVGALYDAAVVDVASGGFAYLRTVFTLKATVKGMPNEVLQVGLYKDSQLVRTFREEQRKNVKLDQNGQAEVSFQVRPKDVGRFAWEVRIPVDRKDVAPSNNRQSVVIKVVRDRIRVLQVCGSPSYDQKFLRLFLKQDPSVDLVSFFILRTTEDFGAGWGDDELSLIAFPYVQLFSEELSSFDLVVFQNFNYRPYFSFDSNELLGNIAEFVRSGKGFVMTGGDRSFDLGDYHNTPIDEILPVKLGVSGEQSSEKKFLPGLTKAGIIHPLSRLSVNPETNKRIWKNLALMDGVNKNRGLKKGAAALLVHPTEKDESGNPMPVLAVGEVGKGRVVSLGVDASWRWSFSEAVEGSGNQAYLRFWKNTLRWLIADPEDRRVVITPSRENALLGEEVQLLLKARNSAYNAVEDAPIDGVIVDPDGDAVPFKVRTGNLGEVAVPFTPKKQGTHYVRARYGDDEVETVFAATNRDPELLELTVDAPFLRLLADSYEGRYYSGKGELLRNSGASRVVPERSVTLLGTAPLVALLFGVFASLAWWIRRRNGGR